MTKIKMIEDFSFLCKLKSRDIFKNQNKEKLLSKVFLKTNRK